MNYEVTEKDAFSNGNTGWICPVCGRGLAPWTSECSCVDRRQINATTTTDTVPKLMDYARLNGVEVPEANYINTKE